MSARLVSLKPFRYASFMAVSISRVRLSGCGLRIFSGSNVRYLTHSEYVLDSPALSITATGQSRALLDGGPIQALCRSARNEGSRVRANRGTFSSAVKNHWQ